MPKSKHYSRDELAAARIEVLSFFVVVFVLCAFVVRWAWNALAEVVTALPAIRFKHALALMLVSGLLLYGVLTMISGARELMTPGAWNRIGSSYELADRETSGIPPEVWSGTHPMGEPLAYVGWLGTNAEPSRILAYETAKYGAKRQVLLVDGTVEVLGARELPDRLRRELDAVVGAGSGRRGRVTMADEDKDAPAVVSWMAPAGCVVAKFLAILLGLFAVFGWRSRPPTASPSPTTAPGWGTPRTGSSSSWPRRARAMRGANGSSASMAGR